MAPHAFIHLVEQFHVVHLDWSLDEDYAQHTDHTAWSEEWYRKSWYFIFHQYLQPMILSHIVSEQTVADSLE